MIFNRRQLDRAQTAADGHDSAVATRGGRFRIGSLQAFPRGGRAAAEFACEGLFAGINCYQLTPFCFLKEVNRRGP
jgi:hypothetical protein